MEALPAQLGGGGVIGAAEVAVVAAPAAPSPAGSAPGARPPPPAAPAAPAEARAGGAVAPPSGSRKRTRGGARGGGGGGSGGARARGGDEPKRARRFGSKASKSNRVVTCAYRLDEAGRPVMPDDGYAWRKYGQKEVKGSSHPRAYYKCTHAGCGTRKQVAVNAAEGTVTAQYEGEHTHEPPEAKQRGRPTLLPLANGTSMAPIILKTTSTGSQASPINTSAATQTRPSPLDTGHAEGVHKATHAEALASQSIPQPSCTTVFVRRASEVPSTAPAGAEGGDGRVLAGKPLEVALGPTALVANGVSVAAKAAAPAKPKQTQRGRHKKVLEEGVQQQQQHVQQPQQEAPALSPSSAAFDRVMAGFAGFPAPPSPGAMRPIPRRVSADVYSNPGPGARTDGADEARHGAEIARRDSFSARARARVPGLPGLQVDVAGAQAQQLMLSPPAIISPSPSGATEMAPAWGSLQGRLSQMVAVEQSKVMAEALAQQAAGAGLVAALTPNAIAGLRSPSLFHQGVLSGTMANFMDATGVLELPQQHWHGEGVAAVMGHINQATGEVANVLVDRLPSFMAPPQASAPPLTTTQLAQHLAVQTSALPTMTMSLPSTVSQVPLQATVSLLQAAAQTHTSAPAEAMPFAPGAAQQLQPQLSGEGAVVFAAAAAALAQQQQQQASVDAAGAPPATGAPPPGANALAALAGLSSTRDARRDMPVAQWAAMVSSLTDRGGGLPTVQTMPAANGNR